MFQTPYNVYFITEPSLSFKINRLPGFRAILIAATSCILPLALAACGGGASSGAPAAAVAGPVSTPSPAPDQTPIVVGDRVDLGKLIFNDTNLSEPRGTACVNCHQPNTGFASNNGSLTGVALGSTPDSMGLRKPMNNSYSGLVPKFSFTTDDAGATIAMGGLFWDGRADTPALQALGPLLNPLEMNNASRKAVVDKIAASRYAPLFKQEFGAGVFDDTDFAFTQIGVAVEAFERAKLQPFTSKFDAMVRGQVTLTVPEARGLAMFQYESKGNCSTCHALDPISDNPEDSLFTDFTYKNTGVPRNKLLPRNADPAFFDLGLCGPERTPPILPAALAAGITIDDFCGKFRVPSLRNVAERTSFMHNGVFTDLTEVVRFYSRRNVGTVPDDLPPQYQRNVERKIAPFNRNAHAGPAMTDAEIGEVVAFLRTLSDGYQPPVAK